MFLDSYDYFALQWNLWGNTYQIVPLFCDTSLSVSVHILTAGHARNTICYKYNDKERNVTIRKMMEPNSLMTTFSRLISLRLPLLSNGCCSLITRSQSSNLTCS